MTYSIIYCDKWGFDSDGEVLPEMRLKGHNIASGLSLRQAQEAYADLDPATLEIIYGFAGEVVVLDGSRQRIDHLDAFAPDLAVA